MRWLRYREAQLQEQAKGKAPEKERGPERARDHQREHDREQTGPAAASAKRSRDYDLSL
jgi:hypothetical protein